LGLGRASATIIKAKKKGPLIEGGKNKGTSKKAKIKAVKKEMLPLTQLRENSGWLLSALLCFFSP